MTNDMTRRTLPTMYLFKKVTLSHLIYFGKTSLVTKSSIFKYVNSINLHILTIEMSGVVNCLVYVGFPKDLDDIAP